MPCSGLLRHQSLDIETYAGKTPKPNNNLKRKKKKDVGQNASSLGDELPGLSGREQTRWRFSLILNANYIYQTYKNLLGKQEGPFEECSDVLGTVMGV